MENTVFVYNAADGGRTGGCSERLFELFMVWP